MNEISNILSLNVDKLIAYNNNAKEHNKEQIVKIGASIREFGFNSPILIDEANSIVAGHGRLLAAKHIGLNYVPCLKLYGLSPEQIKAYRLADNKLAESDWLEEQLKIELKELSDLDFDLELTGFDNIELEQLLSDNNQEVDEDYSDGVYEAKTKLGDIYRLDNHRLICGDCTNMNVLESIVKDTKINMIFTDPPYDFKDIDKLYNIYSYCITDGNIFMLNSDTSMAKYLKYSNFYFVQFFVLDFRFAAPVCNNPYKKHILVSHERIGDYKRFNNLKDSISSIIKIDYRGNIKDEKRFIKHQKTVKDIEPFITHYSDEDDVVLDIFAGSGSTLMACEKNNRICRCIELDPTTCDIIISRWQDYTKKEAELIEC